MRQRYQPRPTPARQTLQHEQLLQRVPPTVMWTSQTLCCKRAHPQTTRAIQLTQRQRQPSSRRWQATRLGRMFCPRTGRRRRSAPCAWNRWRPRSPTSTPAATSSAGSAPRRCATLCPCIVRLRFSLVTSISGALLCTFMQAMLRDDRIRCMTGRISWQQAPRL